MYLASKLYDPTQYTNFHIDDWLTMVDKSYNEQYFIDSCNLVRKSLDHKLFFVTEWTYVNYFIYSYRKRKDYDKYGEQMFASDF